MIIACFSGVNSMRDAIKLVIYSVVVELWLVEKGRKGIETVTKQNRCRNIQDILS